MLENDHPPRDLNPLLIVLLILIPTVFVAAALLALSMCRLAALSDKRHAVALAEWIAASLPEHKAAQAGRPSEQLPFDSRGEAFRAVG